MRRTLRPTDDRNVLRRNLAAAVHHGDDKHSLLHRASAPLHAEALYRVVRSAYARSVRQPQRQRAEAQLFLYRVARRAGHGGDNGAVIAQKRVQKRAFARVRSADYRRGDAGGHEPTALERAQQSAQIAQRRLQPPLIVLHAEVLNVLVRIIEHGVKVRGYVRQKRIHALGAAADRAGELPRGVARGFDALRVDNIRHRLRARQLHPSGQERALCKFARSRLTRAEGKYLLQRRAKHHGRAVALKLRRILAGVAVSGAADGAQAHVQQRPVARAQAAVDEPSVLIVGHF